MKKKNQKGESDVVSSQEENLENFPLTWETARGFSSQNEEKEDKSVDSLPEKGA